MQFVIEIEKRLAAVECLLDAAKNSGIDAVDVTRVFSLFRSIEGLSKSAWLIAAELRFYGAQEWLVNVLLDETVKLDTSTLSALLNLVDEMKVLHEKANIEYVDIYPALRGRMYGTWAASDTQAPDGAGPAES